MGLEVCAGASFFWKLDCPGTYLSFIQATTSVRMSSWTLVDTVIFAVRGKEHRGITCPSEATARKTIILEGGGPCLPLAASSFSLWLLFLAST